MSERAVNLRLKRDEFESLLQMLNGLKHAHVERRYPLHCPACRLAQRCERILVASTRGE